MNGMSSWLWLIPVAPFVGAVVNLFLGRRLPRGLVGLLACGTVAAAFGVSLAAVLEVATTRHPVHWTGAGDWFRIPGLGAAGDGPLEVKVPMGLVVDQLTSVMILVITFIGFLIHLFSVGYMADEKRYSRYFSYLNLFTAFMLVLVLGDNLLMMFVGWEGVGLCSYLLIGFWFEKRENAVAGMKAFVVNRIGDLAFTVGVLTLFVGVGQATGTWTVEFDRLKEVLHAHPEALGGGFLTAVGILLFIGATGKSAQLPLFVWLPDAMEGPTPVSALIHAATMVTAGVYMVARMGFLYAMAPWALAVVATVGALTALFAATIGFAQTDIKKVLAYSTVSQLGFMFVGVGTGAYFAGIFHLMTHACFKACLFLGSGSVIMGCHHEQDIRKMGGLRKYMPVTFATFLLATIAIAGVPPFAGFFSKDEILWRAWSTDAFDTVHPALGKVIWGLGITAAFCTAFYMFRLVFLTFFGEYRGGSGAEAPSHSGHDAETVVMPAQDPHGHGGHGHDTGRSGAEAPSHSGHDAETVVMPAQDAHGHGGPPKESPWTMTVPLVVLAIFSAGIGLIGLPAWTHMPNLFEQWLEPAFAAAGERGATETAHHGSAGLEMALAGVSVLVALAGILLAWLFYVKSPGQPAAIAAGLGDFYLLVRDKYRVDEAYRDGVVLPLLALNEALGRFDAAVIDDGLVDGTGRLATATSGFGGWFDNRYIDAGVDEVGMTAWRAGKALGTAQTGRIRGYVAYALLGILLVVGAFNLATLLQGSL